jgi:acyl-CoA thioester hydrolase
VTEVPPPQQASQDVPTPPPQVAVDGEWVVVHHRVIYGDTDAMGVVYYGNYMRFFELARNELVRARGGLYRELEAKGFFIPVIDVEAKYRAPARYDDVLRIAVRSEVLGAARVQFHYKIEREPDRLLLVTGASTHACVARDTGRAVRLPDEVRAWAEPPKKGE